MTTTAVPLSYDGLTAEQTVHQSFLCHTDWDARLNAEYLVIEAGFEPGYVETLPIRSWLDRLHATRGKATR